MASICCFTSWLLLTSAASSLVLSQRHTTVTTLFVSLSARILMCVLNPLSTSSMRKNNIRKTKTDKVDTFVIAKTLMMQDSLRFVTLKELDYIELIAGFFTKFNYKLNSPVSSFLFLIIACCSPANAALYNQNFTAFLSSSFIQSFFKLSNCFSAFLNISSSSIFSI